MKKIALLAGIGAIGMLLWLALQGGVGAKREDVATPVVVVKAHPQRLYDNVEALGTAYANESVDITASASEIIGSINFTDGQIVKKGDVIVRLEQREEQAQLKASQAQLEEHKREAERIGSLLKNKAASQRDYDERQTLIKITKQEIEAIEARIEDRTLRAPFDGVLGIRRLSEGALVQPGDLITSLDDIHQIKIDFTVPALHLSTLKPGVAIEARSDAIEGKLFTGEIASVGTRVDPVTRSVLVRAIIPNPEGAIRPGLLMQVTLLKNERQAIVVPEESILQRQDDHFVLIVHPENSTVEERRVDVGVRVPGIAEIREGVKDGELVIVRGVNRVKNGQTVAIQKMEEEAPVPLKTVPESTPQTGAAP